MESSRSNEVIASATPKITAIRSACFPRRPAPVVQAAGADTLSDATDPGRAYYTA